MFLYMTFSTPTLILLTFSNSFTFTILPSIVSLITYSPLNSLSHKLPLLLSIKPNTKKC
ncbi:hypothetical protein O3M35_007880 [Rhynocoris fuscipes]|uniref:Uncharacterized protein n=1 Tax=Rhynocoris fuscipes TaxID=488301 RepID=A0AAW1DCI5_9HEMI